jgi:cob(I)alamin adenosyltransferase
MDIYTGRGDEGETDLRTMERVPKDSHRIEAYGTVDELNARIGMIRDTGYDDVDGWLAQIQDDLHLVQADLANPNPDAEDPVLTTERVERLEDWIDEGSAELDPLTSFVLPGGASAGAALHHARTVCRRAERRTVSLATAEQINETCVVYLNRLSDALFTMGRLVNAREGVTEESPSY